MQLAMVKLTEILEIIVRSIINLNLCPTLLYRLLIFPTNFVTGQNAILYVPRCNYQNGKRNSAIPFGSPSTFDKLVQCYPNRQND